MAEDLTPQQVEEIAEQLAAGRKIQAIKLYREATGKGLAEAKQFIDALIPKLKEQDPDKFASVGNSSGAGCGSAVLLMVLLGAAAATYSFC